MATLERPGLSFEKVITRKTDPSIKPGGTFEHLMALTLDPRENEDRGVIRCIESRDGDVSVQGFVDRSSLYLVEVGSDHGIEILRQLEIRGEDAIVSELSEGGYEFLGLEDPDTWFEAESGVLHLYFTISFRHPELGMKTYLGHAEGEDLESLDMTRPVAGTGGLSIAKEVAVAPENADGERINLIESSHQDTDACHSVVQKVVADEMDSSWETGDIAIHPAELEYEWCSGHVSPGPFLPEEFIDVGPNRCMGLLNGRAPDQEKEEITEFGRFSVGLMIYNYRKGEVEWVSSEPLIDDSDARTITFASEFIEEADNGVIFAHIDDSYVRAYTLDPEELSRIHQ